MNYIILAAGRGTRLHPLTLSYPKSSYLLGDDTTVLQRTVRMINSCDLNADVFVVTGFQHEKVEGQLADEDCATIFNPFYSVTNSAASLWFARELLDGDAVIINGDVVLDREAMLYSCSPINGAEVLLDSSIRSSGDYNVQVNGNRVLVMSKELTDPFGEYVGVTRLDKLSARALRMKLEEAIADEMYDQWYENILVHMIFQQEFPLGWRDISDKRWTEVDTVDDLLLAKQIFEAERDCHSVISV